MNHRYLHCLVSLLLIAATLQAQTVYEFKYRFKDEDVSKTRTCFLTRDPEGESFIRMLVKDPRTGKEVLVDMNLTETYFVDEKGNLDSNKLILRASDPEVLTPGSRLQVEPNNYWFYYNEQTGYYDPWAVSDFNETKGVHSEEPQYFKARLLQDQDMTKEYISRFFNDEDGIYENVVVDTFKTRGLLPNELKVRMNVIVAAHTTDPKIGVTCAKDTANFLATMRRIARVLGIDYRQQVIAGSDFNKANIERAVANLTPGKNDITVFYYSGHGFTRPNVNSPLPLISLKPDDVEQMGDNFMSMDDIYNRIKSKPSRLNLVLSDCCNANEDGSPIIASNVASTRPSSLGLNIDNCRKLFMDPNRRNVAMTAAQKGELSGGSPLEGGIFTNIFRQSLEKVLGIFTKETDVSWDKLVHEAKDRTTKRAEVAICEQIDGSFKACSQHPVFKAEPSLK